MAEHLASIFGTEKDRVNCPFYFKIGACRHGERCSRKHNKPVFSQSLLFYNMYQNPIQIQMLKTGNAQPITEEEMQKHFDDFYEDVWEELRKFGRIEEMHVCDNISDHLVGNVYVKYEDEEDAQKALEALKGRYYNGRPIVVEFSPVTDFVEARCRQFEEGSCTRGGYCNFMHLKEPSRSVCKHLGIERINPFSRGSPEDARSCYNCGEPGHIARDCRRSPRDPRACYNCGDIGHFSRDCRKDRGRSRSRSRSPRRRSRSRSRSPRYSSRDRRRSRSRSRSPRSRRHTSPSPRRRDRDRSRSRSPRRDRDSDRDRERDRARRAYQDVQNQQYQQPYSTRDSGADYGNYGAPQPQGGYGYSTGPDQSSGAYGQQPQQQGGRSYVQQQIGGYGDTNGNGNGYGSYGTSQNQGGYPQQDGKW
eukprot:TRINITY_DN6048_c0_g1::TRINITY_DN6048_c0_g1_i1::g.25630::m.25630 TRINITY_DN6048_c0_g1::TRINITY_DN6048_c0_g1_i1::g.25630  ORF type:complete len:419 (+),score=6.79,sp/Q6AUG0/U2AFB_ORYSJ/64.13/1e-83,zf-CCHC/PF00098.18/2.7e-08,zf-CCHC/PF00098.18/3.3e-07,zf-CCCH/PF00642.19/2.4e-06,zf-CCCH/PF00642.19/7.2e-05,RRM_5/PF13893.1/1e-10,RRM_1/PF00076.17/2.6e+03,RRM_1/PF00076.17/1.2e-08,RRM_6/PF14259.1/0.00018,RRM_6/PF14259.1/8.9e+03,DUF1777/PF08648.7/0.00049,Nup35_RRM_2/PF14605.1/0.0017,zf-CCHC_3/PF13917.1/4.